MAQQVQGYLPGPTRKHACRTGKIIVDFAEVIHRVRRRRYPLNLVSSMPAHLFELRRIIFMRRIEWGNWEVIPSPGPPSVLEGRLQLLRETASRGIGGARRGRLRSQVSPIPEELGPITLKDGTSPCMGQSRIRCGGRY